MNSIYRRDAENAEVAQRLATDHHDLRGLNQGVDRSSYFQTQCSSRVAGDDRCNLLAADIDRHLHQQAFKTELSYRTLQLVSTADRIESNWLTPLRLRGVADNTLDFAAGDTVMSSGGFGRMYLAFVDPLLNRRITDARHPRRLHRCK